MIIDTGIPKYMSIRQAADFMLVHESAIQGSINSGRLTVGPNGIETETLLTKYGQWREDLGQRRNARKTIEHGPRQDGETQRLKELQAASRKIPADVAASPTKAIPGTFEKMTILAARVRHGIPIHVPGDLQARDKITNYENRGKGQP